MTRSLEIKLAAIVEWADRIADLDFDGDEEEPLGDMIGLSGMLDDPEVAEWFTKIKPQIGVTSRIN